MATGRGGIPKNPNDQVDINSTWSDIRYILAFRKRHNHVTEVRQISNKLAILETSGFMRNANRDIEFVAAQNQYFLIR